MCAHTEKGKGRESEKEKWKRMVDGISLKVILDPSALSPRFQSLNPKSTRRGRHMLIMSELSSLGGPDAKRHATVDNPEGRGAVKARSALDSPRLLQPAPRDLYLHYSWVPAHMIVLVEGA